MKLIKLSIFIASLSIAIAGIRYAVEGHFVSVNPIAYPKYVEIQEDDKPELEAMDKDMLIDMIYSENSSIQLMIEQHVKYEKYHDLNFKKIMAAITLLFLLVVAALVLNKAQKKDAINKVGAS